MGAVTKTVGSFLFQAASAYVKTMGTIALIEFVVETSKDVTEYVIDKFGKKKLQPPKANDPADKKEKTVNRQG